MRKGSFPLIAKPNSQARCENLHPITIFESTRCELVIKQVRCLLVHLNELSLVAWDNFRLHNYGRIMSSSKRDVGSLTPFSFLDLRPCACEKSMVKMKFLTTLQQISDAKKMSAICTLVKMLTTP